MLRDAVARGLLTRDKIILEPTSGNTGIGLAMVAAAMGYRVKLTMPGCVSQERRSILMAFGAELEITEDCLSTDGAIRRAHEIFEKEHEKYFMPNQFDNPANVQSHYETTGVEIWSQTGGEITAFVAGMGTTGTLMGVRKRLKEYNPNIKIIGVEPPKGHRIQGLKNMGEAIVPRIYDPELLDGKITVGDSEAFSMAQRLALEEGVFVGMSSGAAMAGALRIANDIKNGTVVTLFPDRGDRYLSTALFASVCAKCPP
jgi:cysteine synthase B